MNLYKYLSICIGVIVAIFLGESGMRIYYNYKFSDKTLIIADRNLGYANKPSISFVNKYGMRIKHNLLGFIGEEIKPKDKNILRILGVGDSVTASTYLPEDERYLNRMTEILSKKIGRDIEIINAGGGGYNSWQEFEIIKTKGLVLEPDLIIVGICLNDFVGKEPNLTKRGTNLIAVNYRDGSKARYFDFLYQRSDLYKFLYDLLANLRKGLYGDRGYRRYMERYNFDISPKEFERWKEPFSEMISLSRQQNIKIFFVIFPLENQVIKKENESYKPLSIFFSRQNAYYLDLINAFNKYSADDMGLYRKRDLIHPSSLGHKIASEAIADYILDNEILK